MFSKALCSSLSFKQTRSNTPNLNVVDLESMDAELPKGTSMVSTGSIMAEDVFDSVMDENHKLKEFCTMTQLHKISALFLLKINEWNLVKATNDFFDLNAAKTEFLTKLEMAYEGEQVEDDSDSDDDENEHAGSILEVKGEGGLKEVISKSKKSNCLVVVSFLASGGGLADVYEEFYMRTLMKRYKKKITFLIVNLEEQSDPRWMARYIKGEIPPEFHFYKEGQFLVCFWKILEMHVCS